jgi:hypothetical protein
MPLINNCIVCGNEFETYPCRIKIGSGKYCSPPCRNVDKVIPFEGRLFASVNRSGGEDACWPKKTNSKRGYSTVKFNGKYELTHRASYMHFNGVVEIPKGLMVMHTCDNPPCCNPKHLILGTATDNVHDMHNKGRNALVPKKLTESIVLEIREYYSGKRGDFAYLANKYGVTHRTISEVILRNTWKHI